MFLRPFRRNDSPRDHYYYIKFITQPIVSERKLKDMKVLICDPVDAQMKRTLIDHQFNVDYMPEIDEKQLKSIIGNYNIVVVRSRTKLTHDIIHLGKNLEIIARAGIGTDNIDVKYALEKNIEIVTAAGSSISSVAELNVALAIDLARKITLLNGKAREGVWKKETGIELWGKTAGIIGFGRIGYATSKILVAMGMKILAYDIYHNEQSMNEIGGQFVNLDKLLNESDFLFVLATLSDGAENLISDEKLNMTKEGTFIINTSRAEFIDGKSLLDHLKTGAIGGYASDVLWNEPPKEEWEKELINSKNVIITPHIGAQTVEAQKRVAEYTIENLFKRIGEMTL